MFKPRATITYVPEKAWFEVICREQDVTTIQIEFGDIQKAIEEDDLASEPSDELDGFHNLELIEPHAARLFRERTAIKTDERPSENPQDRAALRGAKYTRDWENLKGGDESLSFEKMLPQSKLLTIQADTGTTLEWDRAERVVHIGADSEEVIDVVQGRLDTVLEDYVSQPMSQSQCLEKPLGKEKLFTCEHMLM